MQRISSTDKTDFVVDPIKMDSISAKIVKADFNGAIIEIVNAKNTQLIGQKGIVAKET
jgi:RNase P/RNase MRP subunit p29